MKTRRLIPLTALAASLATALIQANTRAQTWQTVDDFQLVAGQVSQARDVSVEAARTVFCVGQGAIDSSNKPHAVIRRSQDAGQTWTTVDEFYLSGGRMVASYSGCAADLSNNHFYVGGSADDAAGNHWVVRRSADGGATWSTIDFFQYASGVYASCTCLGVDGAGTIYAAGTSSPVSASGQGLWLVRKSLDGGATWSTVDTASGKSAVSFARAVGFHPTAGVFVVGNLAIGSKTVWAVRRSANGGATWSTVDSYQPSGTAVSYAEGITVDGSGVIYVSGCTVSSSGRYRWIVRRSGDGGTSWTTVDDFRYGTTLDSSEAKAITCDPSGHVYVTGSAWGSYAGAPPAHGLLRKGTPTATGMSWQIMDDWNGSPAALALDPSGNLLMSGGAVIAGKSHWITRVLAATALLATRLAPALNITRDSDQMAISWPTSQMGFILESTPSLATPDWQPAPESPVSADGQWFVTVPAAAGERYFRLVQP